MPTLSKKENFMRLARREMPEYVPVYSLFWSFNSPAYLMEGRGPNMTGTDYFGVEWEMSEIVGAALPAPGKFILKDITKWRDIIKVPDDSHVDWEIMAKQALDMRDYDTPWGGSTSPGVGFFESLMAFMGFDEGLMACYEEPEEVKALLNYLCDWSVDQAKKFIHHYKPDYGFMADDIAHERMPFVSEDMFRDIFAPVWARYYKVFLEADLPVGNHNCGFMEPLLDQMVDMGISFWDPVQSSNDIPAIKAKYGTKLAMCTGMENRFNDPNANPTEEEVRAEYKAWLDKNAPGGAFAVFEPYVPPEGDDVPDIPGFNMTPEQIQRARWVADEFEKLRYSYY